MLKPISDGLYVSDGGTPFMGSHIDIRMSVIRLGNGHVLVFDPIPLDETLRESIAALGTVKYIVAPNRYHHLYVNACADMFPGARILAAPGLPERIKSLRHDETIGANSLAEHREEIDFMLFTAMPMLNEIVFLHRPSRTLLLTDLAFNIQRADWTPWGIYTRLSGAYKKFGLSRLMRFGIKDKRRAREEIDRILGWDIDRIVVSHGDIVEQGGHARLAEAYAWLG